MENDENKVTTENVKTKSKERRLSLVITFHLGVLMIIIITVSVIFFHRRIGQSKELLMSDEVKRYSRYYVMITNDRNSNYWKSIYQGALEEAIENDSYIELLGDNLSGKYKKIDLIRMAINMEPDGIIVQADDTRAVVSLLQEADSKGIPVITIQEDNVECKRKSYVGINGYNLGRKYANEIVDYVKEKGLTSCNVMLLLDGSQSKNNQTIIASAFQERLEEKHLGGVVHVQNVPVSNDADYAAEEEIRDLIVKGTELPDVMICLNEKNTVCAYQTIVDYNHVGEVDIFGYYMSPTIRNAIEKGIIRSTIVADTKQMGKMAVGALNEYKESGYVSELFLADLERVDNSNLEPETEQGEAQDETTEE